MERGRGDSARSLLTSNGRGDHEWSFLSAMGDLLPPAQKHERKEGKIAAPLARTGKCLDPEPEHVKDDSRHYAEIAEPETER